MLLESSSLTDRWTELLSAASRVDIAVAWITNDDRIDDLLTFAAIAGRQVRVIVGVGDYLTRGGTMRVVSEWAVIRVQPPNHIPKGRFSFSSRCRHQRDRGISPGLGAVELARDPVSVPSQDRVGLGHAVNLFKPEQVLRQPNVGARLLPSGEQEAPWPTDVPSVPRSFTQAA
jgi:hypothetical protein